jgi:hypothetical protein
VRNRFSRRNDDADVKGNRRARSLDDRTVEALLSGRLVEGEPELTAFVADVQALRTTPVASDALAAMLADGVTPIAGPAVVPARRSRRPVQVAAAVGAALGLVVSAGAANALPGPVQNGVSDVVGWVTPVDLPRDDHHGRGNGSDDVNDQGGDDTGTGAEPGDDKGGDGTVEPGDDKGSSGGSGGSGSDDSTSGDDSTSSGSGGSGSSGSDDGTSSGSGSSGSGSGSSGSGSGSGGSVEGSDDRSGSAAPTPTPSPTRSASPKPSPTPTDDHSGSSSDDGH